MPCYHPIDAAWGEEDPTHPDPKKRGRRLVFDRLYWAKAPPADRLKLPCRQCIGCRLEHSRQWAMRCLHEASLHEDNCFITLTYREEDLPNDRSVSVRAFQLFMKKMRKRFGPMRVFYCGEYGDVTSRPHYHACLFGWRPDDRKLFSVRNGVPLYTSKALDEVWGLGGTTVGDVTFESAAYIARYVCKKLTGPDLETWEKTDGRTPPFGRQSRRPGIGRDWFEKFKAEVMRNDSVVVRGREMKPPKYYDRLFQEAYPDDFEWIRQARVDAAAAHEDNQTDERLAVREQCHEARAKLLKRTL